MTRQVRTAFQKKTEECRAGFSLPLGGCSRSAEPLSAQIDLFLLLGRELHLMRCSTQVQLTVLFRTPIRRETPIDFAQLTGDVPEGFSEPSRLLK